MADLASPRATRLVVPRWLDGRLALGVLLVLVSIVAGARVFAAADTYTQVYVAAHDLVPGQHLTAADLAVGRVRLAANSDRYVAASAAAPVGYVVTRFVGAHELVPVAAIAGGAAATRSRLVTVPVQPGHLAGDLARGDRVDVYLTAKASAGDPVPAPKLVAAALPVETRDGGARTFSGSATVSVVLSVPEQLVPAIVRAVESGTIDLVSVPPGADADSRTDAP